MFLNMSVFHVKHDCSQPTIKQAIIDNWNPAFLGWSKKKQKLIDTTGITSLNCVFKIGRMDNEKVMKSMKLFAKEVMPQFKDVIGSGQKATIKQ